MRPTIGFLALLALVPNGTAQATQPPRMITSSAGQPPLPLPPGLTETAAPTPGPEAVPESLRSFDPRQLRVGWNNRRWQLMHQGQVLKDFGTQEHDARTAYRIILDAKLNQLGTIGTPQPVMEYWLSNGEAPISLPYGGVRLVSFDLTRLRVEQVQGQWCIREDQRTLFCFGANHQDAQTALAVLRKYRFHQVGIIGQIAPAMCIFLGQPQGAASLPGNSGNHRAMADPRFSRLAKNSDGTPKVQFSPDAATRLAAQGLDGVDQLAQPIVPALAEPSRNQPGQPQPFQWRTRSGFGQPRQIQGERVPFDWRQVNLRQDGQDWKLTAGSLVLANFGTNLPQARLALSALRHYRFTEQHRIGGDQPYFTYFTTPSTTPRSLLLGIQAEEFRPDKLEMKQMESGYVLCEGNRVLVRLREDEDAARKLLEAIKRNRYDRLCRLGDSGREEMNFLVRTH